MRREASIWQQLNRVLRALLAVAYLLVIVSLFLPQHKKLKQSRAEIEGLQNQLTEKKMLFARKEREVNLLKTDTSYLENVTRDRLDMMKPGETVFRLEQK